MIKLPSYLSPRRLAIVDAPDKHAAILRVLGLLRGWPQISDHDRFVREVLAREAMIPTNPNLGIGVPHARSATAREPIAALGVLPQPVADGGSSPAPVGIIAAIGMPQDANDDYLRYLARISCVFGKEANRLAVQACRTTDDLCRLVSQFWPPPQRWRALRPFHIIIFLSNIAPGAARGGGAPGSARGAGNRGGPKQVPQGPAQPDDAQKHP